MGRGLAPALGRRRRARRLRLTDQQKSSLEWVVLVDTGDWGAASEPSRAWRTSVASRSSSEQRVALAQEGGAVNQSLHFVAADAAFLGDDRVHELGWCEVDELAHLARKFACLGALDRGELDYLAGDDRRYLMLGRRFRERARADLVAERAVAEDRVRTDEEER